MRQHTADHLVATQTPYRKKKDASGLLDHYGDMLKAHEDELLQISDVLTVDARFYKAGYLLEFNFRDTKQHTGLNHCQARDKEK